MKKIYFLLLSCLITSASFGQVLEENFDYGTTAGDLTTISGGAWVQHSGSADPVAYVAAPTSLMMTGYPSSGIGGHATYGGSSQDVNRAFTGITSGTVYGSALVNLSAVATGNYFMHFNASGGFRARVGAKDDGNGDILFGIGASSSILTYGTTAYSLNTTYLLVFSYEIATGVSKLHVLSAVTPTEPTMPEATNTGSTGTTISAIAFRQSSNIPALAIDGVRVATSWTDIMNNSTLSTEDVSNTEFSIYPNPATNGFVNITTSSNAAINVSVYDVIGKQVLSQTINNRLDVSNLKTGVYILQLNQNGATTTKKLVIK